MYILLPSSSVSVVLLHVPFGLAGLFPGGVHSKALQRSSGNALYISPKHVAQIYWLLYSIKCFTYKLIILKNIFIFSLIRLFTAVESTYLKNDHQMRYIISVIYVSDRGYSDLMIAKLSTNLLLKII